MDALAAACEEIQRHVSRPRKLAVLGAYLRTLAPADFALAAQFLRAGPVALASFNRTLFDETSKTRLKIGPGLFRQALRDVTGWDDETLRVCHSEIGDTGETVSLLLAGIAAEEPMSLAQAEMLYRELSAGASTSRRVTILANIFRKYRAATLKYFVKVITRHLHLGITEEQLMEALAPAGTPQLPIASSDSPSHTILAVIAAAERGSGAREHYFSSYTVAVRSGDGFVNVGTVDSGLPAREIAAIATRLRSASGEKFGRATVVNPEIVLEIAFEAVEKNSRRKAGYALRSPRMLRWLKEKSPADCDSIEQLAALYRAPGS